MINRLQKNLWLPWLVEQIKVLPLLFNTPLNFSTQFTQFKLPMLAYCIVHVVIDGKDGASLPQL